MFKFIKSVFVKIAALPVLALSSVMAHAQVADPFDAALATATSKVGSYAAALVGLAAVAVIFMIAIKYVKRIPAAS